MESILNNSEVKNIQQTFAKAQYVADDAVAMSLFLSWQLGKPLLIEGPAGVGKTEIAKVAAQVKDTQLIRLQCYEGLDSHQALYEWNYQKQLLYLKMSEQQNLAERESRIFSDEFLLQRPLLQAIRQQQAPVLLIDEVDRADEEFEAFLLEVLADWQISIPEIGTIQAQQIPYCIITSNRVRPLSDALRRRCLYLWLDYPNYTKELAILRCRVPQIDQQLAQEICAFMQILRSEEWEKMPGVVETIDWATTLALLHASHLQVELIEELLGVLFKGVQDIQKMQQSHLQNMFAKLVKLREQNTWEQKHIDHICQQ